MRNVMKSALVGAALLTLMSGCGKDEVECTKAEDCVDPTNVETDEVYVCREHVCSSVAQPYALYGLKDKGRNVYSLGTWPQLSAAATPVLDVVAPEDRTKMVFPGGYLVNDGKRLLSGYTMAGAAGKVAKLDLASSSTVYADVPGNFTATALGETFYVNGLATASFDSSATVWALPGSGAAAEVRAVANTGTLKSYSGSALATANQLLVFGYADASTFENVLFAQDPAVLAQASSAPVDFTKSTKLPAGDDADVTAFGAGLARLRNAATPTEARPFDSLVYLPLSRGSGTTVEVGAEVPVVRFVDGCTQVGAARDFPGRSNVMTSMGKALLLRVEDAKGQRYVRIVKKEGAPGRSATPATDCATAAYDAALGTLQLEPGFSVVDATAVPAGVADVTAVPVAP